LSAAEELEFYVGDLVAVEDELELAEVVMLVGPDLD